MTSPRELVEQICREEFGIGLRTADDASRRVIDQQNLRLQRALEQLSEDLYSKDIHFVLELIQNAEDNDYRKGVKPWLRFTVDRKTVVVENNEVGFTEDNVRAICDVGKTTKRKALGYIGEKGIGFKSVFRVSDEPQIYSRGFQFSFRRRSDEKLGFVVPHWIENPQVSVDPTLTTIILPLRREARNELAKFDEIEPTLLLFLSKLRAIEVRNRMRGEAVKMVERLPERGGIVRLRHTGVTERWRLVRLDLSIPKSHREEKRKDIDATEIVLAFPLNVDGSANTATEQQVFAYLPIRAYGFRFIIHADFLVPANREDVLWDKQWNKHIRASIPRAFISALELFKKDERLKTTFYDFVPLPGDVKDNFFSSVAPDILERLRGSRCMLSASGRWRKPEDVLLADPETRALITNSALRRLIGKEYVSSDIRARSDILRCLGVAEFDFNSLVQCLGNERWLSKKSDEWLVRLYAYLGSRALAESDLRALRALSIIRLEGENQLSSVDEGAVFFPLSARRAYGFEGDLRIVKRALVEAKGPGARHASRMTRDARRLAKAFLTDLGVGAPSAFEVIEKHILPIYESDEWKSKGQRLLGYVVYVKDHLDEYANEKSRRLAKTAGGDGMDPLGRLKKALRIKNSNPEGRSYSRAASVYLPRAYQNPNELETLFEGIQEIQFVSNDYIAQYVDDVAHPRKSGRHSPSGQPSAERAVAQWRTFFEKLGVSSGFCVKSTGRHHLTQQDLRRLRDQNLGWPLSYRMVLPTASTFANYELEPLEKILQLFAEKPTLAKSRHMLAVLERQLRGLSGYMRLSYKWHYNSWYGPQYADATWLHLLKSAQWIRAAKGRRRVFASPGEVFIDSPETRDVLGTTVAYLAMDIVNADLVRALGIHSEPTVGAVLEYLGQLSSAGQAKGTRPVKLYSFLDTQFAERGGDILTAFLERSLILVPRTARVWHTKEEVFWRDVSGVFGDSHGCLEKHYPSLKHFFLHKLGVKEEPTPSEFVALLIAIAKKGDPSEADERIVLRIYEELNRHLRSRGTDTSGSTEEWLSSLKKECVLLTHKNDFWKNDGNLYVNDDPELFDLFSEAPQVAFMKMPDSFHPRIQHLLDALRIDLLSQAVIPELVIDGTQREEHEATTLARSIVPYIERYLYSIDYDSYESMRTAGTLDALRNIEVRSVNKLQVKYVLFNTPSTPVSKDAIYHNGTLLVHGDCLGDWDAAAIELARLLGNMRGLDDFAISLFEKRAPERIERLLRSKHIPPLPRDLPEYTREGTETQVKEDADDSGSPLAESPVELQPAGGSPEARPTTSPHISFSGLERVLSKRSEQTTREWIEVSDVSTLPSGDWRECEPGQAQARSAVRYFPTQVVPTESTERTGEQIERVGGVRPPPKERDRGERRECSSQDLAEIGRWGEEYAMRCLCRDLADKYPGGVIEDAAEGFKITEKGMEVAEIRWLNKVAERGQSYDIRKLEAGIEEYYEVKSTVTFDKEWFELSRGQWDLARSARDRFHLYRVYGAGSLDPPAPVDIPSPFELWEAGELAANPVRIQI